MKKVVIVGAGIAGLTCGKALQTRGIEAIILEKSMGVGGRVATRRAQGTWLDHGLPYLQTGTDPRFNDWVKELLDRQIIQYWTENRFLLSVHGLANQLEDRPFFVCPLGISGIAKYLAKGQQFHLQTKVTALQINHNQWQISTDRGEFSADILVMTPPAPQTYELLATCLADYPEVITPLKQVKFTSTLTLLAGYSNHRSVPSDWEIIECRDNPVLQYLFFNSTKQVDPPWASLILHSTAEFAESHLTTPDLASPGERMLEELGHLLLPALAQPDWWQVHRWRYSRVTQSLELNTLASYRPLPLFFAGDWLAGGGVESAYLSGLQTAEEIMDTCFDDLSSL